MTTAAHETNTGVSHEKVGIWLFLASDFLFFGAFISAFILYRNIEQSAPQLKDVVNIPFTSVTSFILLMSSMGMVLAHGAIHRGDMRRFNVWIGMTALLGSMFVGGQIYEFTEFIRDGFTLRSNVNGSTFFVLTGLHGIHVTVGIVWLLSLLGMSLQGRLTKASAERVEVAGLYWHFVDIIWIVIFTLLYLIPDK